MTDPDSTLQAEVAGGQMRADLKGSPAKETSANKGDQFYALTVASVLRVDYKKNEINLLIQQGESLARDAVPLVLPGAGNRHFFGAMPEPGDLCIVGWGMQESGRTKRPFIVGWLIPGATAGYDWLPTQPFAPEEFGLSPKLRSQLKGVADRVRHKLRALEPGNIAAISSQGSEVILDENVLIANRRGNEIRLRDSDQAIIFRSLQQFHAGAGFRIYSGMVQRDAQLLPTQMFSDGLYWDQPQQVDEEGNSISEDELEDATYPEGFMTPAKVFQRDEDGNQIESLAFPSDLDPYDFLQRGLYITVEGYVRGDAAGNAIYGGKPMFRLSTAGTNAIPTTAQGTFTEYRVEVAHTADGTLPVTEQTDGFDANRIPSGNPQDTDPLGGSTDVPFITSVLGTVVGNTPFTEKGRDLYGVPLQAIIFDGDTRAPTMASGLGSPVEAHAATLFSVQPPLDGNASPTFWSVTKSGVLKMSLSGPGTTWSAELAASAGIRIGMGAHPDGRSLQADLDGAFIVRSKVGEGSGTIGIDLSSDSGAVRLFAGGSTTVGGLAARNAPAGDGEGGLPGLILESATNVLVKASKTLTLSATKLELSNIQQMDLNANTALNFKSGDGISHSSNSYQQAVLGKAEHTYSGPKNNLPTNGALRSTQFIGTPATGFPGGPADTYLMVFGDRDETFLAGNHRTNVAVGTQVYTVGAGLWSATASGSSVALTADGAKIVGAGTVAIGAAGAVSINAGAAATISATALVVNAPAVTFNGPHVKPPQIPGAILTDGCLDPLTGRPFSTGGTLGIQTLRVN